MEILEDKPLDSSPLPPPPPPVKTPGKTPIKASGNTPGNSPGKIPVETLAKITFEIPSKTPGNSPGKIPSKAPVETLGKITGTTLCNFNNLSITQCFCLTDHKTQIKKNKNQKQLLVPEQTLMFLVINVM